MDERPEVEEVPPNPNVMVVVLFGKKYNQIFDPATGTTRLEPLVE